MFLIVWGSRVQLPCCFLGKGTSKPTLGPSAETHVLQENPPSFPPFHPRETTSSQGLQISFYSLKPIDIVVYASRVYGLFDAQTPILNPRGVRGGFSGARSRRNSTVSARSEDLRRPQPLGLTRPTACAARFFGTLLRYTGPFRVSESVVFLLPPQFFTCGFRQGRNTLKGRRFMI